MTSELKVNVIKKNDGSTITIGEAGDTVTITPGITAASLTSGSLPIARIDDDSITNAKLR